jgi:hypothetical protein
MENKTLHSLVDTLKLKLKQQASTYQAQVQSESLNKFKSLISSHEYYPMNKIAQEDL